MSRQKSVDEGVKKDLLKILLEVYMSDGCVLLFVLDEFRLYIHNTGKLPLIALHISSIPKP